MKTFDLIAFDGDDTLWHNERVYRMGRERFRKVLARFGITGPEIEERVNRIELQNLEYYGYGVTSFVLSLIETAIELTDGRIAGTDILELLDLSRDMIRAEVELFDGARDAVAALSTAYPLMIITKGDLLHQRLKVDQSGLADFFAHVEVVSTKTAETYEAILSKHGVHPARFLMIGNSLRSDILPVLEIGGRAVYIPAHLSWAHEEAERPPGSAGRLFDLDHLSGLVPLVDALEGPRRPPADPRGTS